MGLQNGSSLLLRGTKPRRVVISMQIFDMHFATTGAITAYAFDLLDKARFQRAPTQQVKTDLQEYSFSLPSIHSPISRE